SIDETMAVEDGDVVMVPKGYHPVSAPYGYESYYLNVMAGPKRQWHFKNDPAHEWLISSGPGQPNAVAPAPIFFK
ncbi:5-deoxy-glucuronate isomerase, partial [Leeia sp. TBRC 13508]